MHAATIKYPLNGVWDKATIKYTLNGAWDEATIKYPLNEELHPTNSLSSYFLSCQCFWAGFGMYRYSKSALLFLEKGCAPFETCSFFGKEVLSFWSVEKEVKYLWNMLCSECTSFGTCSFTERSVPFTGNALLLENVLVFLEKVHTSVGLRFIWNMLYCEENKGAL